MRRSMTPGCNGGAKASRRQNDARSNETRENAERAVLAGRQAEMALHVAGDLSDMSSHSSC